MGEISQRVIESRLQALADRQLGIERVADNCYVIHRAVFYYPVLDYWRMKDSSATGYGQRGMIQAIDDAQLRGMIPDPPPIKLKFGEANKPAPPKPAAGRDSTFEATDPDKSAELTKPQSAESAAVTPSAPTRGLPRVDWV